MNRMSPHRLSNLISKAKEVFGAYIALTFFKQPLHVSGKHSLSDICQHMIEHDITAQAIDVLGPQCNITLNKLNDTEFQVSFTFAGNQSLAFPIKELEQYDDFQKLICLSLQQQLILQKTKHGDYALAVKLQNGDVIGGKDKYALYNSQLMTLHNIIKKLESEKEPTSLLVALATGSGKSIIQGVWLYVLYLAQFNGIFSVPDKLVAQFHSDLLHLLPDRVVTDILTLRQNQPNHQAVSAIANFSEASPKIILASFEELLDNHFHTLRTVDPNCLMLSFDEQHLIANQESRKVQLFELQRFISLYLTATPSEETYLRTGRKPVAMMSSGQKEKAGQGKFPKLFTVRAETVGDKFAIASYNPFSFKFWQGMMNKTLLWLAGNIQPEISSAATQAILSLPFLYTINPKERSARYRLEVPMARKMLIITNNNEDLVNLFHAVQTDNYHLNPTTYKNGNLVDRQIVYDFFLTANLDKRISEAHHHQQDGQFRRLVADVLGEETHGLKASEINTDLRLQLKRNVYHNLVDLLLKDITGFDPIDLNNQRKASLTKLTKLVVSNAASRTKQYYFNKFAFNAQTNAKGIDADGARALSHILYQLNAQLLEKIAAKDELWLTKFVDNWALETRHCIETIDSIPELNHYLEQHMVMAVMKGMDKDEMPIQSSVPFFALQHEQYPFHEHPQKAKVRQYTTIESLDVYAKESRFTPSYQAFSQEIADNYFKLGLVGMYISNDRTEGFSDSNLHTVVNLTNTSYSETNNPQTLVQGVGRNRGLDETITPVFIHSIGQQAYSPFDIAHLNDDDYFPALYKAQREYSDLFIDNVSHRVAQEVILWLKENTPDSDQLDESLLKRKVLRCICQSIRTLNKANGHNIQVSRKRLKEVLHKTMALLQQEVSTLESPYKLSWLVNAFSVVLYFFSESYLSVVRQYEMFKLKWQSWLGGWFGYPELSAEDKLYQKILEQSSFKELVAQGAVANQVALIMKRKLSGLQHQIKTKPQQYLKSKTNRQIATYAKETIIPLVLAFVTESKRPEVERHLAQVSDWSQKLASLSHLLTANISKSDIDKSFVSAIVHELCADVALAESDIIMPDQQAVKLSDYFSSLDFISKNYTFKSALESRLLLTFDDAFVQKLKPIISYDQYALLQQASKDSGKVRLFLRKLLENISVLKNVKQADQFISNQVRASFGLAQFKTLLEHGRGLESLYQRVQSLTTKPSIKMLDKQTVEQLADIVKFELLPLLVNYFPFEDRAQCLTLAQAGEIAQFLIEQDFNFFNMLQQDSKQAARLIFGSLLNETVPLPEPINEDQEKLKAEKLFAELESQLSNTSYRSLAYKNIMTLNYFNPLTKPHYVAAPNLVGFLQSDKFGYLAGLLLPYDDAMYLCELLKFNDQAFKVAYALLDVVVEKGKEALTPGLMVLKINKALELDGLQRVQTTKQRGVRAEKRLTQVQQQCQQEPVAHLNSNLKSSLNAEIAKDFVPLLVAFIKDESLKQKLSKTLTQQSLLGCLYKHRASLATLKEAGDFQRKAELLVLICNELDDSHCYSVDDFYDVEQVSYQNAKELSESLIKVVVAEYIKTEDFISKLQLLFNEADARKIQQRLSAESLQGTAKAEQVGQYLIDNNFELSKPEMLLETFMSIIGEDPSAAADSQSLPTLEQRLTTVSRFFSSLVNFDDGKSEHLNAEQINQLAADVFTPIFCHQQFRELLANTVQIFNQQDIELLLCARYEVDSFDAQAVLTVAQKDIQKRAADFIGFVSAVIDCDVAAITQLIALNENEQGELSFKNTPLEAIFNTLKDVLADIKDVHCKFNHHNEKGVHGKLNLDSKFLAKLSDGISALRVPGEVGKKVPYIARRLHFVNGLSNGLPKASQMFAEGSKATRARLKRVNNYLLQPLWAATNVYSAQLMIFKFFKEQYYNFVLPTLLTVGNAVKGILNSVSMRLGLSTLPPYQLDAIDQQGKAYHEDSISYASVLNRLQPLTYWDLELNPEKEDVIEDLEALIPSDAQEASYQAEGAAEASSLSVHSLI